MDAIDYAILQALRDRPGATLRHLSAAVGRSKTPVRNRVRQLEADGFIYYDGGNGKTRLQPDVALHGGHIYIVELIARGIMATVTK